MRIAFSVLLISAIFSASSVLAAPRPKIHLQQTTALFSKVIPDLKGKTAVPIRLPRLFDLYDGLVARVLTASADSYEVVVGFEEDCQSQHRCATGIITAKRATARLPQGQPVLLKDNIVGYYRPYSCGAYCSNGSLTWREEGFEYTIEMKMGEKSELIQVANSAIPRR